MIWVTGTSTRAPIAGEKIDADQIAEPDVQDVGHPVADGDARFRQADRLEIEVEHAAEIGERRLAGDLELARVRPLVMRTASPR